MFDEQEIRKTVSIMKPNNALFEVRVIYTDKRNNVSGYFSDADTLIDQLKRIPQTGCNVYITLNRLDDACMSRTQSNRFEKFAEASTSDSDVKAYEWLMIDIDPKRPKGTSSSEEQIKQAKEIGNKVFTFMNNEGFAEPLRAFSGNGVHLLYKVQLSNKPENKDLLKKCLETLSMLFDTDEVKIDIVNHNPSRITKFYGSLAQKGLSTEKRPHRKSFIVGEYTDIRPTQRVYLQNLVDKHTPRMDEAKKYNDYSPRNFDLEDWMSKHLNVNYRKSAYSGGDKYILDCCPFNSNHKGKDACIFRSTSGALGFHCFHNECADKGWKDVRRLLDPTYEEIKYEEKDKKMYHNFNRDTVKQGIIEQKDKPIFLSALDIFNMPKEEEAFIKTGITDIDRRLRGLKKGHVSVWSGLRGSGKSSVLSEVVLSAVDVGNHVMVYSGELTEKNFLRWLMLQACGKGKVEPSRYEGYYNVPRGYQERIAKWLDGKFWLYNNDYGNDFKAMLEQFEKSITEKKVDLLILDNLMSFNISAMAESKWEAQTAFIWHLHELAHKNNIHIAFVAHPKKTMGTLIRLEDIAGTSDLGNAVEDAFMVHRVNNDFKRMTKQMFGWKEDDYIYTATNVIEIAKDRDGGTQDVFVPLWYEAETKRLKNSQTESIIYGWDDGSFESMYNSLIDFPLEYVDEGASPFDD